MGLRFAACARAASSDDRKSQQDQAADKDKREQCGDQYRGAKLTAAECAKRKKQRRGSDHTDRSADDCHTNEDFCEFGIHT